MKKLLALLLALMLPVCALADTVQVVLESKTDDVVFAACIKEMLQKIPGILATDVDKYTAAASALMKDTKVTARVQADAVSMDIALSGSSLLDITVYQTENASCMISSLLPGYALVEPLTDAKASVQPGSEELKQIADGVETAIEAWLKNIESVQTRGVFEGDAYSGGTQCMTWMLTDQDIAALLSSAMTAELRALIGRMLDGSETSAEALFADFDAANARVADEDKFAYILRVVKNDADEFVGLSLSAFEEAAQLATVSYGVKDQEARLVVGLGLNGQNYWWEAVTRKTERKQVTYLKGEMREWVADKTQAFAYVSKTNAAVTSCVWTCNLTKSGQRTLWDGCLYEGSAIDAGKAICAFNGTVNPAAKTLEGRIKLLRGGRNALEMHFSSKAVNAIEPIDPAVVLCSSADPAQEKLYTELYQTLSLAITARMIQLIPLDVILTFGDLLGE